MKTKIKIGTPITFVKDLTCEASEEHPALIFASKGESGIVVGHNQFEGHMVKSQKHPSSFGAVLNDEFLPTTNTTQQ